MKIQIQPKDDMRIHTYGDGVFVDVEMAYKQACQGIEVTFYPRLKNIVALIESKYPNASTPEISVVSFPNNEYFNEWIASEEQIRRIIVLKYLRNPNENPIQKN